MGVRTICALAVCKLTHAVLRVMGHGATSLPGKLALKVDPQYLNFVAHGVKTVVVTGTNGKTTTTHMFAQAFVNAGIETFYNKSGANLIQGVATEFAQHCTLAARPRAQAAVIECDEGALSAVCAALDPAVVVVTNVFRDQLDRYGEVMHTRENIMAGLRNSPHALLCLNADDSLVASIADELDNDVVFFGVGCELYPQRVDDPSDATRCIRCGSEYHYDYRTFGHLGGFSCPDCDFERPKPAVEVTAITKRQPDSCVLEMRLDGEFAEVAVDVPAGYDTYNCCATVAGLLAFGFDSATAFKALGSFKHGFGRSEVFADGNAKVRLMLMKNPAGCNQIINLLLNESDDMTRLVCILNDQDCDGTDVSWIYDAAWEAVCARKQTAICSGSRAEDMALRLKYAGMPAQGIQIEKDYAKLVQKLGEHGGTVTVVANYSAMLEFRAEAAKQLGLAGFWEG